MPRDLSVEIASHRDLGGGNHLLEVEAAPLARETAPGQFFMIGFPGADTLLRRPFSVCGLPGTFDGSSRSAVHVLYKVVGRGTEHLASRKPGSPLSILGPLGRGFDLELGAGTEALLVAGGIGSAPFPALAAALGARGIRCTLLYGARSASDLPLLDWFRARAPEVIVTTEDGSAGTRGLVTDPLRERLARGGNVRILACGPNPMLREVAAIAREASVPCEVSLEARMACGFGVCLGCVVPTRRGEGGETAYERVCVEGPVMPAEKLAW